MIENQPVSNAHKNLSIIALVLGILAFIFSFIPCLGMYAFWPGVAGIILAIVAFVKANKAGASKTMIIVSLTLAIIGTGIAVWQYIKINEGIQELKTALSDSSHTSLDSLYKSLNIDDSSAKTVTDTTRIGTR